MAADSDREISTYIETFRSSASRALHIVYVNTVVSLLVLISVWNTTTQSWADRFWKMTGELAQSGYAAEYDLQRLRWITVPPDDPEWKRLREAYVQARTKGEIGKQYRETAADKRFLIALPVVGTYVHINDLGVLGGLVLFTLSLLLCFAMVRRHENLYLSLFKVTRICERERLTKHDGESQANFLYHALAMSQVLDQAPTLARWGRGFTRRLAVEARALVLCLPVVAFAPVVATNLSDLNLPVNEWSLLQLMIRMGLQIATLLGITALCIAASRFCHAGDKRWWKTFHTINPGLRHVEQRSIWNWLKIDVLWDERRIPPDHAVLAMKIAYSYRPDDSAVVLQKFRDEVRVPRPDEDSITQETLADMAKLIVSKATETIGAAGGKPVVYTIVRNRAEGDFWTVTFDCQHRSPETIRAS